MDFSFCENRFGAVGATIVGCSNVVSTLPYFNHAFKLFFLFCLVIVLSFVAAPAHMLVLDGVHFPCQA